MRSELADSLACCSTPSSSWNPLLQTLPSSLLRTAEEVSSGVPLVVAMPVSIPIVFSFLKIQFLSLGKQRSVWLC